MRDVAHVHDGFEVQPNIVRADGKRAVLLQILKNGHSSTLDIIQAVNREFPDITFIVTYGHRPAYSSGHHPGDPAIQAILDGLGDTHSKYVMNLNGHSHDYERSFPQRGVVHLTVGTGGAALEQDGSCLWLACTQPSWSAFRAMRHGPLVLRFTNGRIQGQFLCGPAGGGIDDINCTPGAIVDSFTITAPGGAGQLVTDSSLVFAEPNVSKPAYLLQLLFYNELLAALQG